ncbi:kinesin-like protein KIF23 [Trichonephila inaurata madagascariensis]|uniref:Kinesin-like protein n=1 Tax=Trichonephila inaurata madagascariensis TaxID=2747483 RepID=A0A8X6X411_9ARAC|nr:kinesin-like protein KIF23 [Trichonephila inaurata madagascariensis]
MSLKLCVVQDPIGVYCRIRPLECDNEPVCLKAENKNTVILFPPEIPLNARTVKEVHYSFKEVFNAGASQKELFDRVCLPLVEDVLYGGNGLIFTYGITSSGKTYTMTGSPQDGGLLPRSLDVIFNSIKDCQAAKFVFKPDKMNAFESQSISDAKLDHQREMRMFNKNLMKTPRREKSIERFPDNNVISQLPPDVNFAIFISYVEIYNNYIYDLLEELSTDARKKTNFNSKMLREDAAHNMYVFGVTENEVKTVEEALDLFYKGQMRRRVSNTALNTESSRSHSIFTIRVVQAPLDPQGAEILLNKEFITISQLSLVDLAGSERCVRTKSTGQKLREAGNINASLMALRNCIECVRESQTLGINKKVPYRESKLTHLFKSFFEGKGKVRMIVCVNPQAEYFDETVHVMKFAEMTQDVVISRSVSTPLHVGLTPGRGKLYREAIKKSKEEGISVVEILPPTVYSLGPSFPNFNNVFADESDYLNFIDFLCNRQTRRNILIKDLQNKTDEFRKNLLAIDNENSKLKEEKTVLKQNFEARNMKVQSLENKLIASEQDNLMLEKQLLDCQEELENTKSQLQNANKLLHDQRKEVENYKIKMQEKVATEKERMRRIMTKRLAEKQAELECKMCITDEKFRQLREILNSDDWDFVGDGINQPVSDINVASVPTVPSILKMPKSKSTLEIPSETRFLKTRSSSNFLVRNMEPSIRDAAKIFEKENMPPFPFSKRTASESNVHPSKIVKTG